MIAKIIIKRRFLKNKTAAVLPLLHDLRFAAMSVEGYISGETLVQSDDPQNLLVITTWQSMESWRQWKNSDRRKALEAMLDSYKETPTIYEEYILPPAAHQPA